MKYLPLIPLLLALALLASCATPEQAAAADAFERAYSAAMADGVIDQAEAAQLEHLAAAWLDTVKETDWGELLATSIGTLIASILGTNWLRNRSVPGTRRIPSEGKNDGTT